MRSILAGVAVCAVLGVAGCGGEDSPTVEDRAGDGGGSTTVTTTATTTGGAAGTGTSPAGDRQVVELSLTGAAVVPGPGADATVEASLSYDGDLLCLAGTAADLGPVVSAQVRAGRPGEEGPAVVDLPVSADGDGTFEGCAVVGAEGGVVLIDPGSYYVELATAEHPAGAVRADLSEG